MIKKFLKKYRKAICGVISFTAFIMLLAFTGGCENGSIGIGEYAIKAAISLIVFGAALFIGGFTVLTADK